MKKFTQLTVSGILISILALGLAGCGNTNNHNTSSSSSKDKTSKVVNKKATTKKKRAAIKNSSSTTSKDSSSSTTSEDFSSTSDSSSSTNTQRQLGLGDTATWTDQYGVTHHVDSDGMDRQTIAGSSQVNYADWYGPLPSNAQINRN